MQKSFNLLLILLLFFSSAPNLTFAEEKDLIEEYKLYAEKEDEEILVYADERLKDEEFELEDDTNVLVNKSDLKTTIEKDFNYIYVTLNPEIKEVPEELSEEIEKVDEIQGFVHIDRLVDLENEKEFLVERELKNENSEEPIEEETDEVENETAEESETVVEDESTKDNSEEKTEEVIENQEEPVEEVKEDHEEPVKEVEKTEDEVEEGNKENSISVMRSNVQETSTSRLGHIRGGNRLIYETVDGKSIKASEKHRDAVYYIKRQAKTGSETYYLLSTEPSSTNGVVGWMKATDLSTHTHAGVSKSSKQLLIKGTGKATSKAWGGSKDTVQNSMSGFKGNTLNVNLTEKVGNNTWYRGKLNGEGTNIWLHSSQTEVKSDIKESNTSRLGHIRGGNRLIYDTVGGKSVKASAKHRDAVYYIKRQAKLGSESYYLLSTEPSSTKGVVGWMKATDLSTHSHAGVSKSSKQLMIKGTGKATSKAWGGSKDTVHNSMSGFKGNTLDVNLTEKIGNNTWYRGKLNGEGTNIWLHSSQTEVKPDIKESNTSRLGHIRGGNRLIYKTIGGKSSKASVKNRDAVYYIKRQAKFGTETYYLLSTEPSSTKGVVGWMKAKDVSTHTHKGMTKKQKQLMIKGTGKGTTKAWGGSKDTIHSSMKSFQGNFFNINLTEKVGKNTWYRGKINGQGANVWLHSSQTKEFQINESNTSRLGHIRGGTRLIYDKIGGKSTKAYAKHRDTVYYIKRQAKVDSKTYYLLSTEPSSTKGVVGWMKAEDVSTHTHVGVTKKEREFLITGTGKATSKVWGGKKETVYASMKSFKDVIFNVNLTEKVGKNIWYRGKIKNSVQNIWLHSSQLSGSIVITTDYGLTLDDAVKIQFEKKPVILTGSGIKIAQPNQIKESLDPKNTVDNAVEKFQFLDLSKRTGLTIGEMNSELATQGVLINKGRTFLDASKKYGINEMYLMVHARLETGNGTSPLSTGEHEVGLDNKGKPQLVTKLNRITLTDIEETYNMFGINAVDTDPARGGAIRAYNEKWFTPEAAIAGGAAWINKNYTHNTHKQNTLYKMRWNPNMKDGAWKQYATDIDWARKQAGFMHDLYNRTDKSKILYFDTPTYK